MEPPAAPGPERLFDSHRFPADGFLLLALLLYAPVGLCLLVLRLFIGVHVFLVSCALPDSVLRRIHEGAFSAKTNAGSYIFSARGLV